METKEIKQNILILNRIIKKGKDSLTSDELSTLQVIKQKLTKEKTKENLIMLLDFILKFISIGANIFKDG
jgi:hypothetical protein